MLVNLEQMKVSETIFFYFVRGGPISNGNCAAMGTESGETHCSAS